MIRTSASFTFYKLRVKLVQQVVHVFIIDIRYFYINKLFIDTILKS